MKTAKQKRFAAVFAGMLCISCLSAPLAVDAESAGTAGENDSIATAEELPLNTAVSGDISAKGDVDFYQFTLPEDGLLQVSMIADWVSDFGDSYRITFYDADGNEIELKDDDEDTYQPGARDDYYKDDEDFGYDKNSDFASAGGFTFKGDSDDDDLTLELEDSSEEGQLSDEDYE